MGRAGGCSAHAIEAVLAHLATWDGSSVLAVHNFGEVPARFTVQLPKAERNGRWGHIFGHEGGEQPEIKNGRLSAELAPYGYHWFGRRDGV